MKRVLDIVDDLRMHARHAGSPLYEVLHAAATEIERLRSGGVLRVEIPREPTRQWICPAECPRSAQSLRRILGDPMGGVSFPIADGPLQNDAAPKQDDRKDAERLDAFERWADTGLAPALVFDDDGHWQVSMEGTQPVPRGDGEGYSEDATICAHTEKDKWHPTVREAIDAARQETP